MELTSELALDQSPSVVFAELERLERYPAWMRLVHEADPLAPDELGRPAWQCELRAKVGPFTRSKRLRMVRTVHEPDRRLRFERIEPNDPDRATWVLEIRIEPDGAGSALTMHLAYGGDMWNSKVLNRVLAGEVERGRNGLRDHMAALAG